MLQHAGLAQIVENDEKLNFYSQELCTSWLSDGTLYNPKICLYLHGYSFKTFFKAGRTDRYDITYDIDAYNKQHPSKGPEDAIISNSRPFPSTSSTQSLESLIHTLNYIEKWILCF